MAITAQRLLNELGKRKWSGYTIDDMVWGETEAEQGITELNVALRYLMALQDFPFKSKEQNIETAYDTDTLNMIDGQITSIYNRENGEELEFIGDNKTYDKELKGKPTHYWVEYNNPKTKIRLYPIADGVYPLTIEYNQFHPVLDTKGKTKKYELENEDDILNLPSNLEFYFMDCLILRCMAISNKDEQDENYRPILEEFNEAWRLFKKVCRPKKQENRIVI